MLGATTAVTYAPVADPQLILTNTTNVIQIMLTGYDASSTPLSFTIVEPPSRGALGSLDASTGQVAYTPPVDLSGSDSFSFTVTSGVNTSEAATVTFLLGTKASQTITFANPGAQIYSTQLTLSATSSSGLAVTYSSITGSKCTISGNVASFVGTGTCTIYAVQTGNISYLAATEVSQSFTVNKASQTITFANPGAQALGTPLTISATASSGLAVTYSSITASKCTVSGDVATFVATGTCTIYAVQAGNNNYLAATDIPQSFTVNKQPQTITFANPGAQIIGTPLTLSATASSGLAVTFASITTSKCTVSGNTVTFVATGTCSIEALQTGNTTWAAATAVTQSFTINKGAQTITFANPGTQGIGIPLTLTATASSGLPITYSSITGSKCTVSGDVATFVATGTCTIYAVQTGNSNYSAAAEVPQSFAVEKGQTITFNNPGTQSFGTPLTLSATASSGLPVSFTSTTTGQCTVSGNTVTFVAPGTCNINAVQAGNSTYAPAQTVSQSFTLNKGSQTITFANPGQQTVETQLTLTATASSGLTVIYSSITNSKCTVSGNTATFVAAGTCTIYAVQTGNADWSAAIDVPQSFAVVN